MDLHPTARRLRSLIEPIAAAVYFAPEAHAAYTDLGLDHFEGYFCSRGACLGRAPWSVIAAAFAAFKPAVVEQFVTAGWAKAEPEPLLEARLRGATAQLERLLGGPTRATARATELLHEIGAGLDPSGRAIYAGLSVLPEPETPWGRLWRAADLVREHRGDGHIAAWIGRTDSTEITLLTELAWGIPPHSYVFTRGWSEDDVAAGEARLEARGLVRDSALTDAGRELREDIERDTDCAERDVIERLGDRADELFRLLEPWAAAIVAGGGYPVDPTRLGETRG